MFCTLVSIRSNFLFNIPISCSSLPNVERTQWLLDFPHFCRFLLLHLAAFVLMNIPKLRQHVTNSNPLSCFMWGSVRRHNHPWPTRVHWSMVDTLFEMCRLTLLPCRPDITNYKVPVLDVHPMFFPHGASWLLVLTNPCHTTKIIESQWGLHYQLYIPKFRFVVYIILHSNSCWLSFLSSAWPSFPMLDMRTTKKKPPSLLISQILIGWLGFQFNRWMTKIHSGTCPRLVHVNDRYSLNLIDIASFPWKSENLL
jgi:hypothetical protein